jgi:hypothetical protein
MFEIQVLIKGSLRSVWEEIDGKFQRNWRRTPDRWISVRPSGRSANVKPYQYETRREAEYRMKMSYPDQCLLGGDGTVRVIEVAT